MKTPTTTTTMKATHTPGPWTVDKTGFLVLHEFYRSPENYGTIIVGNFSSHQYYLHPSVNAANARLAASAPELLEALKEIKSQLGSEHPMLDWIEHVTTNAIARAEGRE